MLMSTKFTIPRVQTRETNHTGEPVDAQYWTVTSDTGPITVGTPEEIKLVSITASGDDGNKPENLLDNDSSNRWSCKGLGSWVKPSFGVEELVTQIEFTWYDKPPRTYDVTVAIGGQTLSHQATLATSTLQLATPAKAKDFTVTLVNTSNPGQWFSITAIKVLGMLLNEQSTVPTTPVPEPSPPSQTPTQPPSTTPPIQSDVDKFGVAKLYADGPGPQTFMNMDDPSKTFGATPGSNPEGNTQYYPKWVKNSDGSWQNTNGKEIRWAWCSTEKYPGDDKICKCYDTNNKNGYMTNDKDWPPRIEMTAYYRGDSAGTGTQNGECHIEHVISGHRSTTSNTPAGPGNCHIGCAGSYHLNKYPLTGRKKAEKDYKHSASYAKDISGTNVNNATPKWANDGKWHGFKDVFYIKEDKKTVLLEQWTDWNADGNWKKDFSFEDDGTKWVPKTKFDGCGGGSQTIAFLFNGPLVVFRGDNWNKVSMKNASVRSIDPTKPLQGKAHAATTESHDVVHATDEIHQAKPE